jgi:hypothetical protein
MKVKFNIRVVNKNLFIVFFVTLLFCSCGEGVIDLSSEPYTPKIVIDGYLQPGNRVRNIIIGRNFPVTGQVPVLNYFIADAQVKIIDLETEKQYQLSYNRFNGSYAYTGNDLIVEYNRSYKLEVEASIDGKTLYASSVTTTPQKGFYIDRELSVLGELKYNRKDEFGDTEYFNVVFDPSPGTDFYILSTTALEATADNYIYNNIFSGFVFGDDMLEHIKDFDQRSAFQLNINSYTPGHNFRIEWDHFWFYADFEVILLACDKNFKEYFFTIDKLQELDGTYHEAMLNFEGDGVGLFTAYIADTVYCRVIE